MREFAVSAALAQGRRVDLILSLSKDAWHPSLHSLDPNARSLLKVEVNQSDEADQIFTALMGDLVEPRRDFIQDNALSVSNLDV